MPTGPLEGLRIVDMTVELIGPYATQMMGDLGAEVIKVEPPAGDGRRTQGPSRHPGMGSQFLHTNRGKRSIAVDLKKPGGRSVVLRLCERADVFVYNSRRQAMRRLGLTYEDVSAANPRIVYCGASGYGESGPYAGKPAYDEVIQGLAAIADLQARQSGAHPRYMPFTFADRAGAMALVNAILSALLARNRTGRGQAIELSMFEAVSAFVLSEHMGGRTFEPPIGGMGIKETFDRRPSARTAMPMHTLESLIEDPHLRAVGFFRTDQHPTEGTIVSFDVPSRWSQTPPGNDRPAPRLGEQTLEILLESGFDAGEVEAMVAAREVCPPDG